MSCNIRKCTISCYLHKKIISGRLVFRFFLDRYCSVRTQKKQEAMSQIMFFKQLFIVPSHHCTNMQKKQMRESVELIIIYVSIQRLHRVIPTRCTRCIRVRTHTLWAMRYREPRRPAKTRVHRDAFWQVQIGRAHV